MAGTPSKLNKELSLFGVFAIATGSTLSAGFFLLPGLAIIDAGPALILSYLIAAALMVPASLCIIELATAMPRAGGAYYFLDRSLGPLAGTIGGVGTWLALTLKTAFALVGMGAYLSLLFGMSAGDGGSFLGIDLFGWIAIGLTLVFGAFNLLGSKKTGGLQIVLVCGLLAILAWFVSDGAFAVDVKNFDGFFDKGAGAIFTTAGVVFISYVGVTKVASVAEEVKDPERNLPLGVFLALGTAVLIYGLGVAVMIGVLGTDLNGTYTCVADVAKSMRGRWGMILASIGAIFAFSSVANGAILSASRYPLAMARDHLVPTVFRRVSGRGAPIWAIVLTVGAVVAYIVLLDPLKIAKLASAFQLLMFALLCLAVIVMRESRIESYDPGYRSPLYPWLQIFGIVAPFWMIFQMGTLPLLFSSGVVVLGIAWYLYYGKKRVERHGAILDIFDRMGSHRFYDLDRELRGILKEKGLRKEDPFDDCLVRASVFDAADGDDYEAVARRAATQLAGRVGGGVEAIIDGFLQGTRTGATPVTGGVALPHMRVKALKQPEMTIVRSRTGLSIALGDLHGGELPAQTTFAIFFLVSPDGDPGQHLRLLAQLASQVDEPEFLARWIAAGEPHELKEILMRHGQHLVVELVKGTPSEELFDVAIFNLKLPEGVLVALIRRGDRQLIPRGRTELQEGDRLTIIGDPPAIEELRTRFKGDA